MVEYALLLTFFAVPVCAAMTAMGVTILNGYVDTRNSIMGPMP